MTGADARVILALDRRQAADRDGLRRSTRLALVTLDVSLRKLIRMHLIAPRADGRFELTARGRRTAKDLRTSG